MNNNDIELAIDIIKEKIPLSMKTHAKKYLYMVHVRGEILMRTLILMLQY